MAHKSTYKLLFKRRRNGKTNYEKRLAMLKSKKLRLVVRKTNYAVRLQVVAYKERGDETVVSATSTELANWNWNSNPKNLPSAYLAGFLIGKRAVAAGITNAILDIGLHTPMHKGRIFSAVKGAMDAGLAVPVGEEALPETNRLTGKHIEAFAQKLETEKIQKVFSAVLKAGFDPKKTSDSFNAAKLAIEKNPNKSTKK